MALRTIETRTPLTVISLVSILILVLCQFEQHVDQRIDRIVCVHGIRRGLLHHTVWMGGGQHRARFVTSIFKRSLDREFHLPDLERIAPPVVLPAGAKARSNSSASVSFLPRLSYSARLAGVSSDLG